MGETLPPEALHQVQVVTLTAFDASGKLVLPPMCELTHRLLVAGVRVFIPCAGSAEFHTLLADEIVAVIRMTRDVVGDRARVLAPVGFQLQSAIDLGRRACDAGADGVLVMPLVNPYLSDVGARDYYLKLLDRLQCPTVIYKKAPIPSDHLLLELAGHQHLIGVKYAGTDVSQFQRLVDRGQRRVEWYCGNAERYAPFFALAGACGYTSGAGNVCPHLTLALHAALQSGDWDAALRFQKTILPIEHFRARADNSFNVSLLKHAIRQTGLNFGQPRPPYRQLTSQEQHEIDTIMAPILTAERELAASSGN